MPKDPVNYKTLSPGCVVDLQALSPEHSENRLIGSSTRRQTPSAGLIVESETDYPVGSLIVLDLKFPGQPYTYRSRGMVSWSLEGGDFGRFYKMGILIFGMDKLDEQGVSLSLAAPSPIDFEEQRVENILEDYGEEQDDEPLDEGNSTLPPPDSLLPEYSSSPPAKTDRMFAFDRTMLSQPGAPEDSTSAQGHDNRSDKADDHVLPVCAVDIKISKWLSRSEEAREEKTAPPERVFHDPIEEDEIELDEVDLRSSSRGGMASSAEDDIALEITIQQELSSSIAVAKTAFIKAEKHESLESDPDVPFDAESKMVQAFERMHELYRETEVVGAGRFVLSLARELIASGGGSLYLISREGYNLYVAVDESPGEVSRLNVERPVKGGIVGHSIQTGVPVICNDPAGDTLFDAYLDANLSTSITNLLAAPVQRGGHVMGAIVLRNSSRSRGFVLGESDLLAYVGSALADYIYTSLAGAEEK